MRKRIVAVVSLLMIFIVMFCAIDYRNSISNDANIAYNATPVTVSAPNNSIEENTVRSAELDRISAEIGRGINLGNDLDVCDWTYFGSSYNTGFQAAIVYETKPWTAWDASSYEYFDGEGKLTLKWDLSKLNSDANGEALRFAIQLVNHNAAYQGTNVTCKVKEATLIKNDDSTMNLQPYFADSYLLTVKDDVTQYFGVDLSGSGLKTKNFVGSTISISLEISDYYRDVEGKIKELEQHWGNPAATQEMITAIKDAGFGTVRVPVTYFNHISSDGTIDTEFLNRVEQVVDWVLESGMYCIIDVHHDSGNDGWIKASKDNYDQNKDIVYNIFIQIAERFKDKDYHLILEGLNEVVDNANKWSEIPSGDLAVMNNWNQLFVDAVRSTGGNNSDRYLLVNTYAALSSSKCLDAFRLPDDTVSDRIFVGIHCYFDGVGMDSGFSRIAKYSNKYNFIIGEWAFWKDNIARADNTKAYVSKADELGIPIIWWDNGNPNETALLDRKNLSWKYTDILNAVTGK